MQKHREAISFQQRFARSDETAAVLAGQTGQSERVDASDVGLGGCCSNDAGLLNEAVLQVASVSLGRGKPLVP